MNLIKELRDKLQQHFPNGEFNVTAPVRSEDQWALDIAHGSLHYVVDWTPPTRFGVSSASDASAYGEGPDEEFSSIDDVFSRLVRLLTTAERPSPPLPALLARVREERGVSQAQLARRLGLAQATVSGYERRQDIQVSTLRKIIVALGGELQIAAVFSDASYAVAGEVGELLDELSNQERLPRQSRSKDPFSFPNLKRHNALADAHTLSAKVASRSGGLLAS